MSYVNTAYKIGKGAYQIYKNATGPAAPVTTMVNSNNRWNRKAKAITYNGPVALSNRRLMTHGKKGQTYRPKRYVNNEARFLKMGYVEKDEQGGVHSSLSTTSMYLGHTSLSMDKALEGLAGAIVKLLYKQAGKDFLDWDAALPGGATADYKQEIRFDVQLGWNSTGLTTGSIGIIAGVTPNTIKDVLKTEILTIKAANFHESTFRTFTLWEDQDTSAVAESYVMIATLRADQAQLHVRSRSRLAVQNRTVAVGAGDLVTDIDSNPLLGKLYGSSKASNGFLLKKEYAASAGDFICDRDFGLIRTDSTSIPAIAKAPGAQFFGANTQKKVVFPPGTISSSVCVWNKSMKFNEFMRLLNPFLADPTVKYHTKLGKTQMFGLEKMLDSQRAAGQSIDVGFELTSSMGFYLTNGKASSGLTRVVVGTTAIPV